MTLTPRANTPSFRTCPACGEPTPADNPRCAYCGASSIEAVFAERKAASERRFLQALFTRSNPFTMIFIGINLGVFALMCVAGGIAVTSPDEAVLIGFGAKQNTLIAEQHQYWRLITFMFIHVGLLHLILNNYALWIIGQEIERIYGSARFVVIYLVTGVIGSLASYVFNPQATSAGASGAIFGLFGAMATFAFKYRREIPELLSREIKRRILPVIAINLLFGFSVKIVDNPAHVGGLLAGIALALLIPYKRPSEKATPLVWRGLQAVGLALIFVCFVEAFRNYNGPPLSLSNLTATSRSSVVAYFEQMKEASRALGESMRSTVLTLEGGNALDTRPASDAIDKGIAAANRVPNVNPQAGQYRNRLFDLLTEQKNILIELARSSPENRNKLGRREEALIERFNQFQTEYGKWLPGFLNEHGYELDQGDQ